VEVRSVPLFASVDEALRHLAARAVERGRYAPDELVFATINGTPLHESNFNRRVWRPPSSGQGWRMSATASTTSGIRVGRLRSCNPPDDDAGSAGVG
jgi:hypothetical protein